MHNTWLLVLAYFTFFSATASQQIWDIWQTTQDRSKLFTQLRPSKPIIFGTPSVIGSANIVVDDKKTFQSILGFGGSLTDSAAFVLYNLKLKNPPNYWKLLQYLFSPTDGANTAGLSYLRVPLGASDFSANLYSFDDTERDKSFSFFDINRAPSHVFSIIKDIRAVNTILRVHIVPWSPPGWMKTSGTMNGGALKPSMVAKYAIYLLKCLEGFKAHGVDVYAISIQNEPLNSNPTYPTSKLKVTSEGEIGKELRSLMNRNGFSKVKLIGYEHNWSGAAGHPIKLMEAAQEAFDGIAFHCYAGTVDEQEKFHVRYPTKEIYLTECTGTVGSNWWDDIKWYMENLFIGGPYVPVVPPITTYGATVGAIQHNAHSALMWNIALDSNGQPKLPGTSSCGGPGCRAIVQVNANGTYSVNQEFYAMAQASKAILPRDVGGPWGKRIGVTVGGELNKALKVGAYVTGRTSSTDWLRYSLVVLNRRGRTMRLLNGGWEPIPVQTTIEFRGMQAKYTFPAGVTTLWWYAPARSSNSSINEFSNNTNHGIDERQHRLNFWD